MRIFAVAVAALLIVGCTQKQAPLTPGGYITMTSGGNCTLTIVQPGNLPKVAIPATKCEFKSVGSQHAFVKHCGRIDFTPTTELPGTKALVAAYEPLLAQQSASCPLRVPHPPTIWHLR